MTTSSDGAFLSPLTWEMQTLTGMVVDKTNGKELLPATEASRMLTHWDTQIQQICILVFVPTCPLELLKALSSPKYYGRLGASFVLIFGL